MQYNDNTKDAAEKLHKTGAACSFLYDASGGCGKSPKNWQPPVYKEHLMGYSGGISPENVMTNLDKISRVLPNGYPAWIDAEYGLKTPTLFDEKPLFDADRAKEYLRRANLWGKQR